MLGYLIARCYSQALFQLDGSADAIQQRLSDLEELVELIHSMPKFENFLLAPQFTWREKSDFLKKCLKGKLDQHLFNFLDSLLKRRRMRQLPMIVEAYRRLILEKFNIIEAQLTTVVPIEGELRNRLQKSLEHSFSKSIVLREHVDPRIIGGLILSVGNQMLDASFKQELTRLKNHLMKR